MNSGYRYILYTLMGLTAAAAVLFLIFGGDILASRRVTGDLQDWINRVEVTPLVRVPEDLLDNPVLGGLVNYSPNFDMDKVCLRVGGGLSASSVCSQGNNLPFRAVGK